MVATNLHVRRLAICAPRCLDVDLRANAAVASLAAFLIATTVMMPRGCLEAVAIVLGEIKLGTASCWPRVAISVSVSWKCDVGIVIHTSVCASQIHIKLHKTTSEIERGPGAHTATPVDIPTSSRELRATVINLEVLAWIWTINGAGGGRTWRRGPTPPATLLEAR